MPSAGYSLKRSLRAKLARRHGSAGAGGGSSRAAGSSKAGSQATDCGSLQLALALVAGLTFLGFAGVTWRLGALGTAHPEERFYVSDAALRLRGGGEATSRPDPETGKEPASDYETLASAPEAPKAAPPPAQDVEVVTAEVAPALQRAAAKEREERDEVARLLKDNPTAAQAGAFAGCRWTRHAATFLGEYAVNEEGGDPTPSSADDARTKCELDSFCVGITCESEGSKCTPRLGQPYLAHSPAGEVSFVKHCGGARVPPPPPPPPPPPRASGESVGAEIENGGAQAASADGGASYEAAAVPAAAGDAVASSSTTLGPPRLVIPKPALTPASAVLVVIAHNNGEDLESCLRQLLLDSTVAEAVTLAVSLDDPSSFERMEAVVRSVAASAPRAPEVWKKTMVARGNVVKKISEHHQFVLQESFERRGFEFAILLENDLAPAPDFLWYFRSSAWLLREDPSLFCVSAWNDNGFRELVTDEHRLFRTDYFPGLGWMIRNDTWAVIREQWPRFPSTGWDHWLRHGSGLNTRECVVPEVSRVKHFGEQGANVRKGSSIAKLLARMAASRLPPGHLGDLSYLLKARYEDTLYAMLAGAEVMEGGLRQLRGRGALLRPDVVYVVPFLREEYKALAAHLRITPSQPRTSRQGVILTKMPTGLGGHATIALVDRRKWHKALPARFALHPDARRHVGAARPGQPCDAYCQERGQRCNALELEFINTCSELRKVFPCEDGCGHQVGPEIPAFVHDRSRDTARQCLVTDDAIPTCEAKFKATTRLCACVPA
eukprot:TRINITY_DN4390_c3_g2_i1.p1 TRINITY_DN4390_c3_g2~~TRINITY_DN4390_c3_g2_i1.p1  ORF type:complete len:779 (-),score=185.29 TRINITY_DN4390_c3_g2_i1:344-2680(-)